jgi:prepilin-type N-terminal cleavage/methylation domain-containing protein
MEKKRGFTIVEILVALSLVVVVFYAAYYSFIHSYQQVKVGTEKMHNLHAVAVLIELLRHELTALPDMSNISSEFIKSKESDKISFNKFITQDDGRKIAIDFSYYLDKKNKVVIRKIGTKKQSFGSGRYRYQLFSC